MKAARIPRPVSRRLAPALLVAGLALAAACGSGTAAEPVLEQSNPPTPTLTVRPERPPAGPPEGGTNILASGVFQLPAPGAFGEPGFHEALTATHELPTDLGAMAGSRLVLRLWDAGRPEITCRGEHPLPGCATVDWPDAPGRPKVPPGGVFDNSITLKFAAGERRLFLSPAPWRLARCLADSATPGPVERRRHR